MTRKVNHFNYARLEEATNYQYSYGQATGVAAQAARFMQGFLKLHPLDAGNEASAFVAGIAFLVLNGWHTDLTDKNAKDWFKDISERRKTAGDAIKSKFKAGKDDHHNSADVKTAVQTVMAQFAKTIEGLASGSDAKVA